MTATFSFGGGAAPVASAADVEVNDLAGNTPLRHR
jgi:hypothetical protein